MPTFAERFVAELHNKPAPLVVGSDEEEAVNDPGTLYLGAIERIADNCNSIDWDYEDDQDDTPHEGSGTYYFQDGSKCGLRNNEGKWDAWVMK